MVRFNTIVYEQLTVVVTLLSEVSCSYTNLLSLMVCYDTIAQLGSSLFITEHQCSGDKAVFTDLTWTEHSLCSGAHLCARTRLWRGPFLVCRVLMFSMLFLSPCSHLPEICQVCLTLGVPLLSVTEWCVSAPLLAVVLSQGCSALPGSVSCNWLASADCNGCMLCLCIRQVSLQNVPSIPASVLFP